MVFTKQRLSDGSGGLHSQCLTDLLKSALVISCSRSVWFTLYSSVFCHYAGCL